MTHFVYNFDFKQFVNCCYLALSSKTTVPLYWNIGLLLTGMHVIGHVEH